MGQKMAITSSIPAFEGLKTNFFFFLDIETDINYQFSEILLMI